jgi:hypothetical protein
MGFLSVAYTEKTYIDIFPKPAGIVIAPEAAECGNTFYFLRRQ